MPDGRVQRIDPDRGMAYVIRRGRLYPAPLSELEMKARVPSARVTFSVTRERGEESAADVKLRAGTRTGRRQRRFGDLTGAKDPGSKVVTSAARQYGVDVATQPFRVIQAWAEAMSKSDIDGAVSLYLPDAVVHTSDNDLSGWHAIKALLASSDFSELDLDTAVVSGHDRAVRLDVEGQNGPLVTWFDLDRGSVIEQWIDSDLVEETVGQPALETDTATRPVNIVADNDVPEEATSYAEGQISYIVDRVRRPLLFGRMKLRRLNHRDGSVSAEAMMEWPHLLIRAHATAPTFTEAIDKTVDRLAARLEHTKRDHRSQPSPPPLPDAWADSDVSDALRQVRRPADEERELVRHKSFAPEEMTVDEAAWDMGMLDYDFFLFVDLASGQDSLLERSGDGNLTLRNANGEKTPAQSTINDVEFAPRGAHKRSVAEAMDYLDQSDDVRLFFVSSSTGRGNVVYRRHDGHFGLITPPDNDMQAD